MKNLLFLLLILPSVCFAQTDSVVVKVAVGQKTGIPSATMDSLNDLTNKVKGLITWGNVLSKPSTYAPSSHNHAWSEITSGIPTTLAGYGITDAAALSHTHVKADITDFPTTTSFLSNSTNKNFVTDAQATVIENTSGTNTGDNAVNSLYSGLVSNANHTGDATGSTALTLATVNSNTGSFGSGTQVPTFTVNGKGLITAASNTTIAIADANVSTRKYVNAAVTGTDANIIAAPGTSYHLPAATLTANRTFDVTGLNTEGDYIEIYNNEAGFTWSFTGASVYLSDETTTTVLLANTNYILRFTHGKIRVAN